MNARLREALRTGSPDPWADSVLWKSSPSPPPAPDYRGAAQETAAGNKESAVLSQQANLVNQNTPYGSLTYREDPTSRFSSGNPSYSSDINLNDTGKQLLDTQNAASLGLGESINRGLADVQNQGPMGQRSVQDTADRAYKNYTARLDPQWQHARDLEDTRLRNQGVVAGGEAYDNEMRDFNNAKNDAYTQANTAAISTMPQTYQLASAQYNQPLNYLNALRTGAQVTNPQFGSTPQQQMTPGPNYLGAAQAQGSYDQGLYNIGVGQSNSANSGTMSLIGSGIGAAAMFF